MNLELRDVIESDLAIFFEQQLDEEANYMAAFTVDDPTDRKAFDAHWGRIMANDAITKQTIVFEGKVVGNISFFEMFEKPSIGYWLGKDYWGKGIATKAVSLFLEKITTRPLYARVAKDNIGSRRVLEKSGFKIIGNDKGFAHARGEETEEYILELLAEE